LSYSWFSPPFWTVLKIQPVGGLPEPDGGSIPLLP